MFQLLAPALSLTLAQVAPADFEPFEPTISEEVSAIIDERGSISNEEWIARLDALGEAGDYSAWELLGELYAQGASDIARDTTRACDYFERIGANRADALHSMAGCFFNGDGREQDYARARTLYGQAIDAGYITSLCGLGTMLVRGWGGEVDAVAGVALCRQAAELGDRDAQTDLGIFLLMGQGVERNPVEARIWLEEAGGQGQANASYLLGQIYGLGDGVRASEERAEHWFRRAHDAGRPDAAWQLAGILGRRGYREENGETQMRPAEIAEAREWALIAAQTDPDAQSREQAASFAEAAASLLRAVEQ